MGVEMPTESPLTVEAIAGRAAAASQALATELERAVLRVLRPLVAYFALPLLGLFAARAFARGTGSFWLAVELMAVTVLAAGLTLERFSARARRLLLVGALTVTALMALLHYGPLLGTGLFFTAAVLSAAFFFGTRGAVAVGGVLTGSVVILALTLAGGQPPLRDLGDGLAWVRLSLATGIGLAGCSLLFLQVDRSLRLTVRAQVEELERLRVAESGRERELRRALTEQRLESLARLAGGVAHDINNALLVIQTGVELLAADPGQDEREELLAQVREGLGSAVATTRQLLSFAGHNAENVGSCVPAEVIASFAESLPALLPNTVEVAVDVEPTPAVPLARSALERVLVNLVLNARDAVPDGGAVTLGCRAAPSSDGQQEVVIEVADDGVGMDSATRERAFEPFFTTREGGLGLGLPMVWGLVARQGGRTELHSKPGRGTRVTLWLPTVVADDTSRRATAPVSREESRRILVLEDEPGVRNLFGRILERAGFEVSAFETAREAREVVANEAFDLLLTDGVVPGGGVPELIRRFRCEYPGAPVLVCSGYLEEELTLEGIARGEYRFVPKPFAPATLVDAIEAELERSRKTKR